MPRRAGVVSQAVTDAHVHVQNTAEHGRGKRGTAGTPVAIPIKFMVQTHLSK